MVGVSKFLLVLLFLLSACSAELKFTSEDLTAIEAAAQAVFEDEARHVAEFEQGILPEAFAARGAKAAHIEKNGLYLVYYGYLEEESGVFVPRAGSTPEEGASFERLGRTVYWYHIGG